MLYIEYLEKVEGIRLSVSYPQPNTNPIASLLKENLKKHGIEVEQRLVSIEGTFPEDFQYTCYESVPLSSVVKSSNFASIEDMKNKILEGFSKYNRGKSSEDKDMVYSFEGDSESRLTDYFKKTSSHALPSFATQVPSLGNNSYTLHGKSTSEKSNGNAFSNFLKKLF